MGDLQMKEYKAVSGPQAIDINANEDISGAARQYAQFINGQAALGWKYNSSTTVIISKKGGCLRKNTVGECKMMIFERESSSGVEAPSVTEPIAQAVQNSTYENDHYADDTVPRSSGKKRVIIIVAVAVILLLVIGIAAMVFRGFGKPKPHGHSAMNTSSGVTLTGSETATSSEPLLSGEERKYVKADGGLIIRSIPSTEGEILGVIPDRTEVTVRPADNGWATVTHGGVTGWVFGEYLYDVPEQSASEESRIVQPEEKYEIGYHCVVRADGGLCLRSGPDTAYDVILVIPDGTEVEEFGFENEWVFTEYQGQPGWVSSRYLEFEGGMAKPVIYLYPETETEVSVKVRLRDGDFSCTYPDYKNGWNVIARPDGTLINKADGKEYSYLFWESRNDTAYDFSEGFVVKGSDTAEFLQKTLSEMGLTPREYNEFIVYWLPLMQENAYNLITFQQEAYTSAAVLDVSPKPDSMLRVFMAYKALEKPISIPAPTVTAFDRHGFTVVEWGGTEVGRG